MHLVQRAQRLPLPRRGAQPEAPANVWILSATTALIVTALYTWYPVLPVVLERRGASSFAVSAVYTAMTLAASALQLYGGRLADRFGRKPLLALPTFSAATLYTIIWLSHDWQLLAFALILLNASGALQSPSFVALTSESVAPERRAHAFSTFQFAVGLATLAGPALGALLLPRLQVQGLMALTVVATLVAGIGRLLLLQEVRPEMSVRTFSLRDAFSGRLRQLTLASTAFLAVGAVTVNGPFIALFAHHVGGLHPSQVNLLYAVGWLPAVLLSFWLGRRISSFGSARALAIGVGGHLGVLGVWLLSRGLWPMMALLALSFLFYQLALIAFGTLRMELIGSQNAGAALGAIGTVSGVASALGPVLGGALAGSLGPLAAFGVAGAAGIWTLWTLRTLRAT